MNRISIIKAAALRFSDYIKQLPSDSVFLHLVQKSPIQRRILSSALLEEVCTRFLDATALRKRFSDMSGEAQRICALAYLAGQGGFSAAVTSSVQRELIDSFLVYAARNSREQIAYIGFHECAGAITELCGSVLARPAGKQRSIAAAAFWKWRAINDLTILLAEALRGGLLKTQKGGLVRVASQLLKKLFVGAGTNITLAISDDSHEQIVCFLIEYCLHAGLLDETEKGYSTSHSRVRQTLDRPMEELWRDLYAYALDFCGEWRMAIIDAPALSNPGEWLLADAVIGASESHAAGLHLLHYLGRIDAVRSGATVLFHPIPVSTIIPALVEPIGGRVIISADFTVVLGQEISPLTLYTFSLLGNFLLFDCVYKARITRETVNSSLGRGISGDDLISFLLLWHAPDNVVATVAEWIREFSRLYMHRSALVASFDDKTTLLLQTHQPLQDLIVPVGAHAVFFVREGSEKQVHDILDAMGFDDRFPAEVTPPPAEPVAGIIEPPAPSLVPVFDLAIPDKESEIAIKTGKYSAELKQLDPGELMHVIDYAILIGNTITIDYQGSQAIRKGIYTLRPTHLQKTTEPILEGVVEPALKIKTFHVKKISKIGVNPA
jgi:hypothetical protein